MTVPEVALWLKLARITVYKHAAAGLLPAFKVGSARRFRRSALERWVNEMEAKTVGKNSGMTLLEILVVLYILGFLSLLVVNHLSSERAELGKMGYDPRDVASFLEVVSPGSFLHTGLDLRDFMRSPGLQAQYEAWRRGEAAP